MKDTKLSVGQTILFQLGWNEFTTCTGCRNFCENRDEHSLSMTIPKNRSGANRLTITLTPDDLYRLEFYFFKPEKLTKNYQWRKAEHRVIAVIDSVYCESLRDIFEQVTGLYTSTNERK